jgi:hypothetical protein
MATLDVLEVELTSFTSNLDVLEVQLVVDALPSATLDVLEVQLVAPLFTQVSAGPDRTVDGLSIVTIDPSYQGSTPTQWFYAVISVTSPPTSSQATPSVVLSPEGDQVTFVAPATYDGVEVVIGVSATNGTTLSEQDQVKITVYPHAEWDVIGGAFVPVYEDDA